MDIGPHAPLDKARARRAEIYAAFSPGRLKGCSPADVRDVIVIDSASRSGSSLLYYLLSSHPGVVSLNGEGSVFEKLHGIGAVESADDSDAVAEGAVSSAQLARAAEDILIDSGALYREDSRERFPENDFIADSVQRLSLQYPEAEFPPSLLREICAAALAACRRPGASFSPAAYWLEVLRRLSQRSFPVSPRHYDLPRGPREPAAKSPAPPPFRDQVLEEPPFVVAQPRIFPSRDRLQASPLLLKSSCDCHRMWLVRKMFPNARFKFVVLTRNPAGAINGLMDGWLSNGFYSRDVGAICPLDIRGYTRKRSPWTSKWWKFDLPPGWADVRKESLARVCALQWSSANEQILRDIKSGVLDDFLSVRYESLLDPATLASTLGAVFEFAGLKRSLPAGPEAPLVMSVRRPTPGKWRRRRDDIAPLLPEERVSALAHELGYDPRGWEAWP